MVVGGDHFRAGFLINCAAKGVVVSQLEVKVSRSIQSAAPSYLGVDDRALLSRIAAREVLAFEILHARYYRPVMGFARRLTEAPDLVEEICNDTLRAVWHEAAGYHGTSKPSTWIFGIAYRVGMNALRRIGRHPETGELEVDVGHHDDCIDAHEARDTVTYALSEVPVDERAVVELTYAYGYTYSEVAEILGCPAGTVKTRMSKARHRMQQGISMMDIVSSDGMAGSVRYEN